ncbi:hypothetical protein O3G_MSEX012165 [Manduca sexta]|uniref:Uncharacterized protein n=1 Tax=Manduca sexta TaxID=7130 RepID=A0A922CWC2_MANSE|nr:hypothetical protein O3G_MSEX012165 [Manduca sexta]
MLCAGVDAVRGAVGAGEVPDGAGAVRARAAAASRQAARDTPPARGASVGAAGGGPLAAVAAPAVALRGGRLCGVPRARARRFADVEGFRRRHHRVPRGGGRAPRRHHIRHPFTTRQVTRAGAGVAGG